MKRRIFSALRGMGILSRIRDSEWRRRRLLILCYHGVSLGDEHEWAPALYVSPEMFARRLRALRDGGYNVLPLGEGIRRAYDGTLPARSVALTFDDGTYDFYARAYPLLQRYGFPATVYLTTYYSEHNTPVFGVYCAYLLWSARHRGSVVDARPITGVDEEWRLDTDAGRNHAHSAVVSYAHQQRLSSGARDDLAKRLAEHVGVDHEALLAKRLLHIMTPAEAAELSAAGVDIQLHTHRHRTPADRGLFLREIDDNRRRIEALRGSEARHFCYPNGDYRDEYVQWLTDAGVDSATTCDPGFVSAGARSLLLPRFVDTSVVSDVEFDGWLTGAAGLLFPRKARQARAKSYVTPKMPRGASGPQVTTTDGPVARASEPVRVLLVGPSLDILGGQAVQAARLLRRLREVPEVGVEFLPVNPRLPAPLRALQQIRYVRTVVTSIAYWATLLRRVPRCDVVHAFSASYSSYLLAPLPAMIVGRLFGRRVVLNYRSGEAADHLSRSRLAVATMRALASEIVVPSAYLVGVFARSGLTARAISNFVESHEQPYRIRRKPRAVFLSNRNLEPMYNVRCIVRAFAIVQRQLSDARLTIAGDGSERGALQQLVKQLKLRNVEFVGRIPPEQMGELYDAADIYLNAPDIDNMPNSVIEAFAAGLPVVTTNAGGIPFVVDHEQTGLMVDCDDHEALASAALRLIGDSALAQRLAARARTVCEERYAWEAVRDDWAALYLGTTPEHESESLRVVREATDTTTVARRRRTTTEPHVDSPEQLVL